MKIGIIGSGNVGKALGSWAAKVGSHVSFVSRDPAHAREASKAAGENAQAVDIETAASSSDLLLLTLPFSKIDDALLPIRKHLDGKTLVDVSNPISGDHRSLLLGHTTSGAEEIGKRYPDAYIVKAFNAVFAEVYASQKPELGGKKISIFFAGDHQLSKGKVRQLIAMLGFDPVDAGPLINARYLEPLSLLNIHLGRVLGFGTEIGFSLLR